MNSLSEVPFTEFQKALTPEKVRSFQVVHLGLGLGVFVFGLVVLYLWFVQGPEGEPEAADVDLAVILSIIHLLIAVSFGALSSFLSQRQFSPERLRELAAAPLQTPEGERIEDPVEKCFSVIRIAIVVRLAMLEAVALFGLIVCTITIVNGVLPGESIFLLNAISPAAFVVYVLTDFPTTERLHDIFRKRISGV